MKHLTCILLLIIISFSACRQDITYPSAMLQAEALMNIRPDSALILLESIEDTLTTLPEEARMYHQLLTIQAKDKQYITHTDDSLINRIVSFYENYGNNDRLMMAYFYQGSTYRDMNDAPRALKAFHQAIDAGKNTENLTLLGQTYGQMGSLFTYQKLYDEALGAKRIALQLYTFQKDSTRYPYLNRDIARIYSAKENNDSALHYYIRAYRLAIDMGLKRQSNNISSELGCLYYNIGRSDTAKIILQNIVSTKPDMPNVLLYLGKIYHQDGQLDSARYCLEKVLQGKNIRVRRSAYQHLYQLSAKEGWDDKVSIYWDKYRELQDSIDSVTQTEEMEKYHLLYRFQRSEKEMDALKLKDQQKQSLIDCLLLAFLLCVVSILSLAYSYRKKKKEVENQELRLQQIIVKQNKKENICKTNDIESTIHPDIYLLFHKAIQDNVKLTEKDWELLKESLDETYPNLIFRIHMLYSKITQHQLKICYLAKLKFTNDNMAKLLVSTPAAISIARKRLYEKITGKTGKPEDFNNLISDL